MIEIIVGISENRKLYFFYLHVNSHICYLHIYLFVYFSYFNMKSSIKYKLYCIILKMTKSKIFKNDFNNDFVIII